MEAIRLATGLSIDAFCKDRGIARSTYYSLVFEPSEGHTARRVRETTIITFAQQVGIDPAAAFTLTGRPSSLASQLRNPDETADE